MFKFRVLAVALCLSSVVICAVWAAPKRTPKQKAQDKCDSAYLTCVDECKKQDTSMRQNMCNHDCVNAWDACYKKIGMEAPLRANLPEGGMPKASATPGAKKLQPQGTLTQASPTPTPAKILQHASPTPGKKEKKK